MAKSIKFKNNIFLDSSGVVHDNENLDDVLVHNIKLLYSYEGSNTSISYEFPHSTMYLVVVMQNGNDNYCIVDIVYSKGNYKTRIKDNTNGTMSVTYSNHKVNISFNYAAMIKILELPHW